VTSPRRPLAVLVSLIALASGIPAAAQPYRWVDAHGNVHYTDRPPQQGAVKIENMNPAARHRASATPPPGPAEPARSTPEPAQASRSAPAEPSRSTAPVPAVPTASAPVASNAPPPRPAAPARQTSTSEPEPTASVPATTATGDDDAPALARDLMRLSGVDDWLDRIVTLARDEFGQLRWWLDNAEAAWAALARGFRRDEMTPAAARCMLGGLAAGEREAVLALLRSPLVQRTQRLRDEAANPARGRDYRQFVSKLPNAPPPSTRVALVQTLEREGGAAGFEIEMRRAVHHAVNDVLRPLMTRGRHALEEPDTHASRAAEDESVRFQSVTMLLFAYRSLSREDLEELVRIARSPGRARFLEVQRDCIRAALAAAERRASREVRPQAAGQRASR